MKFAQSFIVMTCITFLINVVSGDVRNTVSFILGEVRIIFLNRKEREIVNFDDNLL